VKERKRIEWLKTREKKLEASNISGQLHESGKQEFGTLLRLFLGLTLWRLSPGYTLHHFSF